MGRSQVNDVYIPFARPRNAVDWVHKEHHFDFFINRATAERRPCHVRKPANARHSIRNKLKTCFVSHDTKKCGGAGTSLFYCASLNDGSGMREITNALQLTVVEKYHFVC